MPRDSSGNYSLPPGINPVITGTTIASTWANPTMNDIATELTDSLDRSGKGSMLAALQILDGTVGAPGLTFGAESTTGLYRISANTVGFSVGGQIIAQITQTDLTLQNDLASLIINDSDATEILQLGSFGSVFPLSLDYTDAIIMSEAALFIYVGDQPQLNPSMIIEPTLLSFGNTQVNPETIFYGTGGVITRGYMEVERDSSFYYGSSSAGATTGFLGFNAATGVTLSSVLNFPIYLYADGSLQAQVNPADGSSLQCVDDAGTMITVGWRDIPLRNISTGAITLADRGKGILSTASSVVFPANASVPFPIGTGITVVNGGAGAFDISVVSDTLILVGIGTTGTRTLGAYGQAFMYKISSTIWYISGTNLS